MVNGAMPDPIRGEMGLKKSRSHVRRPRKTRTRRAIRPEARGFAMSFTYQRKEAA